MCSVCSGIWIWIYSLSIVCVFMGRSDTVGRLPSLRANREMGEEFWLMQYWLKDSVYLIHTDTHTHARTVFTDKTMCTHTHFLENAPAQQTMNTLISQDPSIDAVLAKIISINTKRKQKPDNTKPWRWIFAPTSIYKPELEVVSYIFQRICDC